MRLKAAFKDWRRRRALRRAGIGIEIERPQFAAGARSGVWVVDPTALGPASVVYSFGVGDNVAWDLAMIERFGCTVHAFDPTPRAVQWLAAQRLPAAFRHHALALGPEDGELAFAAPRKPRDVNFAPQRDGAAAAFRGPAARLQTIAARLGHDHVDVLKLDIEGGEYDVLPDLLAHPPRVEQLLVEFHHGGGTPLQRTVDAVAALRAHGYRVFHVSRRGLELSLLRPSS